MKTKLVYYLSLTVATFWSCDDTRGAVGDVLWQYQAAGNVRSSAAIADDGKIYFGCRITIPGTTTTYDGNLYCFDPDATVFDPLNPQPHWVFEGASDWIDSSPAIGNNGVVYFGSWDKNLYGVNAQTGALQYSYSALAEIYASPSIGLDGTVYFGASDGILYALDETLNTERWLYLVGNELDSSPALASDGSLYVGCFDGALYAFDTGAPPGRGPPMELHRRRIHGSFDGGAFVPRPGPVWKRVFRVTEP